MKLLNIREELYHTMFLDPAVVGGAKEWVVLVGDKPVVVRLKRPDIPARLILPKIAKWFHDNNLRPPNLRAPRHTILVCAGFDPTDAKPVFRRYGALLSDDAPPNPATKGCLRIETKPFPRYWEQEPPKLVTLKVEKIDP